MNRGFVIMRRESGRIRAGLLAFFWLLAVSTSQLTAAEPARDFFEQGNKSYEQGKFDQAITSYEKAIQSGQSNGAVFFNLGNAYYKAGQKGKAIAAYREAEKTMPRDPGLRYNLQFVRSQVAGAGVPVRSGWKEWLARLTLNEWTMLFVCWLWLFMGLLALREMKAQFRKTLSGYTATAGGVMVLLAFCLAAAAYANQGERAAVIIVSNAVIRFGPLDESNVAFQLRDGSEITLVGEKRVAAEQLTQTWYHVQDAASHDGWVKADQVQLVP
jgi:tetratricopeptide (TPR) repeat protein